MKEIIAPCGITCTGCQAYIATQANDSDKLNEIAKNWSDEDTQYKLADIVCDGCFSQRVHTFCKDCEVRNCAIEKGYQVCSECAMYPCDRLSNLWNSFTSYSVDDLKATLGEIAGRT